MTSTVVEWQVAWELPTRSGLSIVWRSRELAVDCLTEWLAIAECVSARLVKRTIVSEEDPV